MNAIRNRNRDNVRLKIVPNDLGNWESAIPTGAKVFAHILVAPNVPVQKGVALNTAEALDAGSHRATKPLNVGGLAMLIGNFENHPNAF